MNVEDRQKYNLVLVGFLEYIVKYNEDVRFFQAFVGFYQPIMDELDVPFYQEPWDTLEMLEEKLQSFEEPDFIEKLNELKQIHL